VFFTSRGQDDREFPALSEYIIIFLKSHFFTDDKLEIKRKVIVKHPVSLECHGGYLCNTRIILQRINVRQYKFIWDNREFQALSECITTFIKTSFHRNNNLKMLRR
jgi:hypothetical protein